MRLENELLLASAARLYTLGLDLEGARETLRTCVEEGMSCDLPEVRRAYAEYTVLREQFTRLEDEYLSLRDSL